VSRSASEDWRGGGGELLEKTRARSIGRERGAVSCEGAITAGGRKGTTGDNEGFVFDEEVRREEY
jgi:hypothetical protein